MVVTGEMLENMRVEVFGEVHTWVLSGCMSRTGRLMKDVFHEILLCFTNLGSSDACS